MNEMETFPEMRPFWEAAEQGQFLVPLCTQCQRRHWFPRFFCPYCSSLALEWKEVSGEGEIYSFTRVRGKMPYVVACVTLDEGPTMFTNIIDDDIERIAIGDRVLVDFRKTSEGVPVPIFRKQEARG